LVRIADRVLRLGAFYKVDARRKAARIAGVPETCMSSRRHSGPRGPEVHPEDSPARTTHTTAGPRAPRAATARADGRAGGHPVLRLHRREGAEGFHLPVRVRGARAALRVRGGGRGLRSLRLAGRAHGAALHARGRDAVESIHRDPVQYLRGPHLSVAAPLDGRRVLPLDWAPGADPPASLLGPGARCLGLAPRTKALPALQRLRSPRRIAGRIHRRLAHTARETGRSHVDPLGTPDRG